MHIRRNSPTISNSPPPLAAIAMIAAIESGGSGEGGVVGLVVAGDEGDVEVDED